MTHWARQGLVGAWCPSVSGSDGYILRDLSGMGSHAVFQSGISPTTAWQASSGYVSVKYPSAVNGWLIADSTILAGSAVSSVLCWFSFTTYKINNTLISISPSSYDSSQLDIYPGDTSGGNGLRITWSTNQVDRNDSVPLNDGNLHLLVLSNESDASHSVYLDGSLVNSFTTSRTLPATTSKVYMGGANWGSGSQGNYFMFDTRIYNRALTFGEAMAMYNGGPGYGLRPKRERRYGFTAASAARRYSLFDPTVLEVA